MGRKPGTPKTGGRKKGTPNKYPGGFRDHLRAYCALKGVDPHHFMVDLLADTTVEVGLKLSAAKELAQYLECKQRQVDMTLSGMPDSPLVVVMRRGPNSEV